MSFAGESHTWLMLYIFLLMVLSLGMLMLRLLKPIQNNMQNFLADRTGISINWIRWHKAVTFCLSMLVAGLIVLFLSDVHLLEKGFVSVLLKALPIPLILIWGGLLYFLFKETWDMYWKITIPLLAQKPLTWIITSLLFAAWLCILYLWSLGDGIDVSSFVLLLFCCIVGWMIMLGISLLQVVRGPQWGRPPAKADDFFSVDAATKGEQDIPAVKPWCSVPLDTEYGGEWFAAGDVDNDGEVEIVTARNFDKNDVHHTTSLSVQKMDGTVLWRWGDPTAGKRSRTYDVACQIHDWNGDGKNEVIITTDTHLIEFEGASGKELRRISIPKAASDCIAFCDLDGKGHKSDIIVKDRYHNMWVLDGSGRLRWTIRDPGGYMLAHLPLVLDIDGDGRDEILAGFALLNPDGTVRWTYENTNTAALWFGGHVDGAALIKRSTNPEDTRIAITYCDAGGIAVIDGCGRQVWELTGHHFESISLGYTGVSEETLLLVTDLHHQAGWPKTKSPLWILNEDGTHRGTVIANGHQLLDFDGDGVHELITEQPAAVWSLDGRKLLRLQLPESQRINGHGMRIGDMDGDGVPDVVAATENQLHIFLNTHGCKPVGPVSLGIACSDTTVYNHPVFRYGPSGKNGEA